MNFFYLLLISFGISMDAFGLSLAYGTLNIKKKEMFFISLLIGLYHLVMPFLGAIVGKQVMKYIFIDSNILLFIILSFTGILMFKDGFKKEKIEKKKALKIFLLCLSVSIDSFTVGFGLASITKNYALACAIFSFTSFIFSLIGFIIGNKIQKNSGRFANFIGGIILVIVAFLYLI